MLCKFNKDEIFYFSKYYNEIKVSQIVIPPNLELSDNQEKNLFNNPIFLNHSTLQAFIFDLKEKKPQMLDSKS